MKTLALAAALATLALALGPVAGCRGGDAAAPAKATVKVRYTCPMHPAYISDRPGNCPICGMRLVVMKEAEPGPAGAAPAPGAPLPAGLATITIDAERRQLIGLRTARAAKRSLQTSLRATGRVAFDETRVHHVHTKYEAFVDHVHADFTGKYVRKGEPLVSIYSPDLLATEQEYLLALRTSKLLGGTGLPDAAESARQRLLLWDISPEQIAEIERSGRPSRTLELRSPASGHVVAKTAIHGMKVEPTDNLFDIADLSHVWVIASVYEYEVPRVRLGQKATMTLSYWPDRRWAGRVDYIFPTLDPKTRTLQLRLDFDNPKEELKPEMFAEVTLEGAARTVLAIPDDAILDTGTRKVVFLSLGEGRLEPREVVAGAHGAGFTEVLRGVVEGDEVATGANFLVDSESRLRSAVQSLAPTDSPPAPAPAPAPGATTGGGK